MILGLVQGRPSPKPLWLSDLRLSSVGRAALSDAYLAADVLASSYQGDGLTVVAESGRGGVCAATVAKAYRRFGHGCTAHLPGRFALIVHDGGTGQLFASGSTAPAWPLSYWSSAGVTVVCSRLLPLLRCPDVPRVLDESYLVHFVMGLSSMREGATPLRGIRRLCPGEALIADGRGARVSQVDNLTPRALGSTEPRGEALLEELGTVVGAYGPTAAVALSGGLDSAALVSAGLRRTTRLPAFSFIAPALAPAAEIAAIDAMERAWPRLDVTRIDASSATELPDLGPELRDDPQLTPLALLPARMQLWSRAREAGFSTVIEGEGGDELFSMLPTPLDALRRGHVLDAARHVLGSSGRRALVEHGLWLPLLPRTARRAWLARRQPIEVHLPSFAAWDARQHPVVREAASEYLATLVHRPFPERVNEWLSAPMVVGAGLSRRHLAAGFGLELEWPMLERGVLELVLGLHAARAIRGGQHKPFLQDALRAIVPDRVRLASKDIGLYRAFIPRVLTSRRAREAVRDVRVRRRLADLVRFERIDGMLDGLASGRSLGHAALWQLECIVAFADWYSRASREHGVD